MNLTDRRTPRTGKWKEFNKHGVLIAEGCLCNARKDGQWKEYYDFGGIMIREHYTDGIPDGKFQSFHPNGQLLSEGNFVAGKREGCFRVFNDKGHQIRTLIFINDLKVADIDELKESSAEISTHHNQR